ncbi:MAG: PAS domain S-box protein [Actinobacteria bacterium]|nr:PAS domain S-box protein [Actinomycetota bacterium]
MSGSAMSLRPARVSREIRKVGTMDQGEGTLPRGDGGGGAAVANGAEASRLAVLRDLEILDSPPEEEFDELVRLASYVCKTPISLLTLVDEHRQWFKAQVGLEVSETPREWSFCAHAIEQPEDLFVVPDAAMDARFKDNPLVVGDPNMRFYAGIPLTVSGGRAVGTVCVIDTVQRDLDDEQVAALRLIAQEVEQKIERRARLKRSAIAARDAERKLQESERRFSLLVQSVSDHAIFLLDAQGRIASWNTGAERIFGYSEEEVLGQHFALFYPDDAKRVGKPAEETRLAADAGVFEEEGIRVRKDGSPFWVTTVISAIQDEQGSIQGFAKVTRDITERKDAEERLQAAFKEVIARLSAAAEFRDEDTGRHIERVGRYSELIAQRIGLPEERCDLLRLAAPLHDVGKIGVPDAILLKPGKLDAQEFETMMSHTEIGHRLLTGSSAEMLKLAATIALTHHERWDGAGYPRGLSDHAIPIEGRIVAVADVFDALTSKRPYKSAMPIPEALAILKSSRGSHFEPEALDAFLDLSEEMGAIRRDLR